MIYEHIIKGRFISRPNRFIAHVLIKDQKTGKEKEVICHVKNTGRCRELLLPGVTVLLQFHPEAAAAGRKTEYSLIGVYKEREEKSPLLINMDSQAPNQVAYQWLSDMSSQPCLPVSTPEQFGAAEQKNSSQPVLTNIKREVTYDQSRFDLAFQIQNSEDNHAEGNSPITVPAFMEVKGVTLEDNGIASFPDAPTERGIKHIMELAKAAKEGYAAYILFVIQMKEMHLFTPNWKTHPQFGDALKIARDSGVYILAYYCIVTENSLAIDQPVSVEL